jgi:hypothetical protein
VSYKEPPINAKCRQGANPWSMAPGGGGGGADQTAGAAAHEDERPAGAVQRGGAGVAIEAYAAAEVERCLQEVCRPLRIGDNAARFSPCSPQQSRPTRHLKRRW